MAIDLPRRELRSHASPAALDAMRHFFSAHTSPELWKDKSLMALVQGKPATAQDPPPQTLCLSSRPFTPPDIPGRLRRGPTTT